MGQSHGLLPSPLIELVLKEYSFKDVITLFEGKSILEIETPALIVNLEKLKGNIGFMSDFIKEVGCTIRPHFKTHKCPVIAHMQMQAGASGITCAKTGEAEVLAKCGISDILIANQVVEKSKLLRLAGLAKYCTITIAADDEKNMEDVSDAAVLMNSVIRILIDVDVGMGRCGVRSKEQALSLAAKINGLPGLQLIGVMGYEGHCVFLGDDMERETGTKAANSRLVEFKEFLGNQGYCMEVASGSGTGTCSFAARNPGMTEMQAGSYVFMDEKYKGILKNDFGNSLYILSTVISRPCKGLAVLDCGMKSMTHEFGMPAIISHEGMIIRKLSEEHANVELTTPEAEKIRIGEKVKIIPSHCCTTVNLHDRYVIESNGRIAGEWEIYGRGKSV